MDRRAYPRFSVSCPVRFRFDVSGCGFFVPEFDSSGTVTDISRKGMRARVDRLFAVGTQCSISLVDADGLVAPQQLSGRVRRSSLDAAGWSIGVEFDSLVELLPDASRLTDDGTARSA